MNRKLILSISLASLLMTSNIFAEDTSTKAATTETTPATAAVNTSTSPAPIVGGSLRQVDVAVLGTAVTGWSAHKQLLDKTVYNDKDEKVGDIRDLIITPDRSVSYAIVGVGGFLGIGERDIAIDSKYFTIQGDKVMLDGATKDLLKQIPEFKYADKQ